MKTQSKPSDKPWGSSLAAILLAALLLIFVGGGIIFASLFLEERQEAWNHSAGTSGEQSSHSSKDGKPVTAGPVVLWATPSAKVFPKFFAEIGLALISIGAIALLLEVPFMSSYFQAKIARTIIRRDYLKSLKKEQLETLQADSLKAYWELDDIDREGTLFEYCKNEVQGFIAKPFRENVSGVYTINCIDQNTHEVEEVLSYTCRATRGRIQPEVRWSTRKGEIGDVLQFNIRLEVPKHIWDKPRFPEAHPGIPEAVMNFDKESIAPKKETLETAFPKFWKEMNDIKPHVLHLLGIKTPPKLTIADDGLRVVYQLSLDAYEDVDELRVSLNIKYRAPVGRSLTWQMSHPSKNVDGVVYFPPTQNFFLETFGISEQYLYDKDKLGTDSPQRFEYKSWLLPESGFVFHLLPRLNGDQSCPEQTLVATESVPELFRPSDTTH
jgi:hypothetical protein